MKKKFSIVRLNTEDRSFGIDRFFSIQSEEGKPHPSKDDIGKNILIQSKIFNNRFFSLYFEEGNALPRAETVYDSDVSKDVENPRHSNQIERREQTFILIDSKTQKVFLSNFGKKQKVIDYLKEKLVVEELDIKNIIDRNNFTEQIKKVERIYFAASPGLFTAEGILGEVLSRNINNYGVDIKKLGLYIKFDKDSVTQKLKGLIEKLLDQQEGHLIDKLEVCGRSDENFERVFNTGEIIDKIEIDVEPKESGMFDRKVVFEALIQTIEKTIKT